MAVFGAPIFIPYSAQNAVNTGLDMLKKLEVLQKKWESEGNPSFRVRIGINTGEVIAGNIGSPDRMDYTVVGDNANLASRIESYARPMTVLISESTYTKVKDIVIAKKMEPIMMKGESSPVVTYEVTSIQTTKDEKTKIERRFVRKNVSIFATFKTTNHSKTNQCILQNVSAGGLLISSRMGVPIGEKILLDFTLPDNSIIGGIEGKVVQSSPLKDKQSSSYFKMGIEFVSLNNTNLERISNFTLN